MPNWFYRGPDGSESGPVTARELRDLASAGKVTGAHSVRKEDSTQWVSSTRIRGLIPEQTPRASDRVEGPRDRPPKEVTSTRQRANEVAAQNAALGCCVFFIPFIFAWVTLRRGYSTRSRVLAFSWLVITSLLAVTDTLPVGTQEEPDEPVLSVVLPGDPCVLISERLGVRVATTRAAYDLMIESLALHDDIGLANLVGSGAAVVIPNHTDALMLERTGFLVQVSKVRLTAGDYMGQIGWVDSADVHAVIP